MRDEVSHEYMMLLSDQYFLEAPQLFPLSCNYQLSQCLESKYSITLLIASNDICNLQSFCFLLSSLPLPAAALFSFTSASFHTQCWVSCSIDSSKKIPSFSFSQFFFALSSSGVLRYWTHIGSSLNRFRSSGTFKSLSAPGDDTWKMEPPNYFMGRKNIAYYWKKTILHNNFFYWGYFFSRRLLFLGRLIWLSFSTGNVIIILQVWFKAKTNLLSFMKKKKNFILMPEWSPILRLNFKWGTKHAKNLHWTSMVFPYWWVFNFIIWGLDIILPLEPNQWVFLPFRWSHPTSPWIYYWSSLFPRYLGNRICFDIGDCQNELWYKTYKQYRPWLIQYHASMEPVDQMSHQIQISLLY